jgi:uncharacterized protein (TIGR00730 family)
VPVCPEVAAGLPTPRPAAEIRGAHDGRLVLRGEAAVVDAHGRDLTPAYVAGADEALAVARARGIRLAVLKDGSPSCGTRQIYDGTFRGVRVDGAGVTAARLEEAGIRVFGEDELESAGRYLESLERGPAAEPRELRRVCVFTGSSPGASPAYREAAVAFGHELAAQGVALVYGGARVGLMGALADAVLERGGEAIGIVPDVLLGKEVTHPGLTELRIVGTMHERKAAMTDLADAFVALPGGMGTLDELAEMLTWAQLGLHTKPCSLLNVAGYYDQLLNFLDHAVRERFVRIEHRAMLIVESSPRPLFDRLRSYRAPALDKWIDRPDVRP